MNQTTPGPWSLDQKFSGVFAADGIMVAKTNMLSRPDDECNANARLIAAAPDLLAALKQCRDQLVSIGAALGEYTQPSDVDAMNAADAAIAKAEGAQS